MHLCYLNRFLQLWSWTKTLGYNDDIQNFRTGAKNYVNDNNSGDHDKNDNNFQGQKMVLVFLGSTVNFIQDSSHTTNMIMGKKILY